MTIGDGDGNSALKFALHRDIVLGTYERPSLGILVEKYLSSSLHRLHRNGCRRSCHRGGGRRQRQSDWEIGRNILALDSWLIECVACQNQQPACGNGTSAHVAALSFMSFLTHRVCELSEYACLNSSFIHLAVSVHLSKYISQNQKVLPIKVLANASVIKNLPHVLGYLLVGHTAVFKSNCTFAILRSKIAFSHNNTSATPLVFLISNKELLGLSNELQKST